MQEKHKDYFEGTLQLRDPSEGLYHFVLDRIERDGKARITKIKKVKGGYDIYITSNKYLRQLGKILLKNFCGEFKESVRLFTRDRLTQKEVFRVTVMFKLLPFRRGAKFLYHGEAYQIISVGKHIFAKSLEGGKRLHLNFRQKGQMKNYSE